MDFEKWLKMNTSDLSGKTIAVTGTTGGLGTELCKFLCELNANLVLLDHLGKVNIADLHHITIG